VKTRQGSDVAEMDTEFHSLIYAYVRSRELRGLLGIFQDMILRDRVLTAYSGSRRRQIQAERVRLVAVLEAHDANAAE
jgi:pentatricopeptide repeat protein